MSDQQPESGSFADSLKPNRFWRVRLIRRAIAHVLRYHAGVSVTVFGTLAALGGILVGLGVYEVDNPNSSAVRNGWVRVGGVLVIVAALCSVLVLFALVVGRYRDNQNRAHLVLWMLTGERLRSGLDEEKPAPEALIKKWQDGVLDLLRRIDDTSGLFARFLHEQGVPIEDRFPPSTHKAYDELLQRRLARLAEFIAELDR